MSKSSRRTPSFARTNGLSAAFALALVAGLVPGSGANAADGPSKKEQPRIFKQLLDCRALSDATQRLACYDQQVAALDKAAQDKDVVIAERQDVEKARRGLFGFAAPVGTLLGFGGNDGESDEIKEVTTSVTSARRVPAGWLVTFEDGSSWEQHDTRSFVLSPKPGNPARIKRGALGTYLVSVNGQPSIQMRRIK